MEVWHIALLALLSCPALGLKIGAFNVKTLGTSKASKPDVMELLGKILRRYDIVLVQEIRDSSGQAPHDLLEELNRVGPYTYDMIISDRLGRKSYKEQYAFYYRSATGISVVNSYLYDDGDEDFNEDTFIREPFVVHFHINFAVVKDIVFIPLHASPTYAVEETSELVYVYDDAVALWGRKDALILGDFNADCSYIREDDWPFVKLRMDPRFDWEIKDYVDTTLYSTDCAYDRIVVAGDELQENVVGGSAKAFRFDDEYQLDDAQAKAVSDHYPVEIDLAVDETL